MQKLSITKALSELKLLDARINKEISNSIFVVSNKKSAQKVNFTTKDDFEKDVKSKYESVQSLIKRRDLIKRAIVMSNAVTKVTIADVEMTVADAIERKTSIVYEQTLLNTLKRQTMNSKSTVATENQKVEIRLDQQLNQMFGNDNVSAKTSEGAIAYAKEFRNQNEFELIDPLSIDKEIEKLEKGIDDFLSEVDYVLSTSNALTEIEIE